MADASETDEYHRRLVRGPLDSYTGGPVQHDRGQRQFHNKAKIVWRSMGTGTRALPQQFDIGSMMTAATVPVVYLATLLEASEIPVILTA